MPVCMSKLSDQLLSRGGNVGQLYSGVSSYIHPFSCLVVYRVVVIVLLFSLCSSAAGSVLLTFVRGAK